MWKLVMLPICVLALLLASCGTESVDDTGGGGIDEPTTVDVRIALPADESSNAGLIAFQDGSGEWQGLTVGSEAETLQGGGATETYQLEIEDGDGRFGLALVCVAQIGDEIASYPRVFHLTTSDSTELDLDCPAAGNGHVASLADGDAFTVSGSLTGLDMGDVLNVTIGNALSSYGTGGQTASPSWSYGPLSVAPGTYDMVAMRREDTGASASFDSYIIKPGFEISDDVVVDFDFPSEGFEPEEHTLTVDNLGTVDNYSYVASAQTPQGLSISLGEVGRTNPGQFRSVAADELGSGGINRMNINASRSGSEGSSSRALQLAFTSGSDLDVSLPAQVEADVEKVADSPYAIYTASWNDVDATFYELSYSGWTEDDLELWTIYISDAWQNGDGYTLPDLSTLEGWDERFRSPGEDVTATNWSVTAHFHGDVGSTGLFDVGVSELVDGALYGYSDSKGELSH